MSHLPSRVVFSTNFCLEAVKEVAADHLSSHTARGVDGVAYDGFMREIEEQCLLISAKSLAGRYRFSPYREKLILKGAESPPRKVSIPTIRDRVALRCLNNFLCQVFSDCKPPHAHPVVTKAIKSFEKAHDIDSFIKLDVKSFYDNINHDVLFRQLRKRIKHQPAVEMIISAVRTPTGARVRDEKENSLGVPQGLSISNILASIYMRDLDREYESRLDLDYYRYVDDILIRTSAGEAPLIARELSKKLKQARKLSTHPIGSGKSAIYSSGETVPYLGYSFEDGRVSVRESSVKKMMSSLMRIIAGIENSNVEKSIWRLNLRISGCRIHGGNVGWLFYFSQIDDHRVLFRLDKQIKSRLVRINRSELYDRCKKFIKAHREIRYSFKTTSYIFDFDTFSRAQQLEAIYLIRPETNKRFDQKTNEEVRAIFFRTMYREAREMERDTLGSFS